MSLSDWKRIALITASWFCFFGFYSQTLADENKGISLFVYKDVLNPMNPGEKGYSNGIEVGLIKGEGRDDGDYDGWALVYERWSWRDDIEHVVGEAWNSATQDVSGNIIGVRRIAGGKVFPAYSAVGFLGGGVNLIEIKGTYTYDDYLPGSFEKSLSTDLFGWYVELGMRQTLGPATDRGGAGLTLSGKLIVEGSPQKKVSDGFREHKFGGTGGGAMVHIGFSFWAF